jgi:hypothetical protein
MAHEKSEDKHPKENKSLQTPSLKYHERPGDKTCYVTVPVLWYQVNINTWQERQGIIFELEELPLGAASFQTKDRNPIINFKLQDAVYEFNIQLKEAIKVLKQSLISSLLPENLIETLQGLLMSRPEEEKRCDFDPLKDSFEYRKFTIKDVRADAYPYICATGVTYNYHLATIVYDGALSTSLVNLKGHEPFYYKNSRAVYMIPNYDLANFIKGRQKFVNAFIEAVEVLLAHKYEPTWTSYTSLPSDKESTTTEYVAIEPAMVVFLLEAGIPWQYFSSQDIYQVICKLCLTKELSAPLSSVFKEALNAPDNQGKTPLMYAIELEQHAFCAEILWHRGADSEAVDQQGRRVLDYVIAKTKSNKDSSWRKLLSEVLEDLKPKSAQPTTLPQVTETQLTLFSSSATQQQASPSPPRSGVASSELAEDESGSMSLSF